MSQAAFLLLTTGLHFKDLSEKDKNLFKKGKHSKAVPKIQKSTIDIPNSIDFFHYSEREVSLTKLKNRKRERLERKASFDLQREESIESTNESGFSTNDEINEFRHHMRISVSGGDIPAPISSFDALPFRSDQLPLKKIVLHNIEDFEYKEPTPIQMQSIPVVIQDRDLLGIAPTGSGKTAAYLIPLIQRLHAHETSHIRSVILTPTLELSAQVHRHLQRLSHGSGLKSLVLSKSTMYLFAEKHQTVDCLISTPLRLISAIDAKAIDLSQAEILILDEGDKLFEDGFIEQVDEIMAACSNPHLQRLLFSATLPQGVEAIARTVLRDPIRVLIGQRNTTNSDVEQKLIYCGKEEGKLLALRNLIQEGFEPPMLIFVQSKERARQLYTELAYDKINVDVIHSDLSHSARTAAINKFRMGETWVLIATDLLGRGLDFLGLNTVVNYDFPQSGVDYIHRIGRTGRAGRKGKAITLFTEDDKPMLRSIANVMKISGCDVPEWMLELKKINKGDRKRIQKHGIKRDEITTQAKFDKKKRRKEKKEKAGKQKTVEESDDELVAPAPEEDLSLLL